MDNDDPNEYGRCKVKVYPMLSDVETVNLPWAIPLFPIVEGSGSDKGYFCIPDIGTHVYVMFEYGDINQPIILGEAPDALKGLPSERTTNYPNRKVIKFSSGIVLYIDDTAKNIHITHPEGTLIDISTAGKVTITSVDEVDVNATGDINVTAVGDVNIVGANVNINGS